MMPDRVSLDRWKESKKEKKKMPVLLSSKKVPPELPWCPVVKNMPVNAGGTGSIPGPQRFHVPQQLSLHHNS